MFCVVICASESKTPGAILVSSSRRYAWNTELFSSASWRLRRCPPLMVFFSRAPVTRRQPLGIGRLPWPCCGRCWALRGRLILALGLCGRSALALLWVLLSALWGRLVLALGLRGWSALTLLWALLGALRGRLVLALGLRGRSALALLWELLGALRGRLVLALGLCGRPVLALLSF